MGQIEDIYQAILAGDKEKFAAILEPIKRSHPNRKPELVSKEFDGSVPSWAIHNLKFESCNFMNLVVDGACKHDGANPLSFAFVSCEIIDSEIFGLHCTGYFLGCTFRNSTFADSTFRNAAFEYQTNGLETKDCRFIDCQFGPTERIHPSPGEYQFCTNSKNDHYESCRFQYVDLQDSCFQDTNLIGAGAATLKGVTGQDKAKYQTTGWIKRISAPPWTRLKALGELPLFATSYSAIVLIWALVALAKTVKKVGLLIKAFLADPERAQLAEKHKLAYDIVEKIAELCTQFPVYLASRPLLLLFTSLVGVAFFWTLYRCHAPNEIREYSPESWSKIHQRPELYYQVQNYSKKCWRGTIFYGLCLSGLYLAFNLAWKVIEAVRFLTIIE